MFKVILFLIFFLQIFGVFCQENLSDDTENKIKRKGLVLGFYEGSKEGEVVLSKVAQEFQKGKQFDLVKLITVSGLAENKGKCNIFFNLDPVHNNIALTNLGKQGAKFSEQEQLDEAKENIRSAVGLGVNNLVSAGVTEIDVDPCSQPQAAAEGAFLTTWVYDELKSTKRPPIKLTLFSKNATDTQHWNKGQIYAEGQNLARTLMETPANLMTPTIFAKTAADKLAGLNKVTVTSRDKKWAEQKKMGAFLSVTQGTSQPPVFLEVHYQGNNDAPVAFVGKGITFDSGGLSLKPSASMVSMRADMGGAAVVLGAIYTAAKLKLPIHVKGFIPLAENMPGNNATKPSDVHYAMNGKSIQIDNTDAEGRLVMCDALVYAETFKPSALIDVATLTGSIASTLAESATGVFTNSEHIWKQMHSASVTTGDRVWKMPLFKMFTSVMTKTPLADLNNVGSGGAGASTAAAFLQEFVTNENWMHMDIAGVMSQAKASSYYSTGMTGRPSRTIVEFLANYKKTSKLEE